MLLNTENEDTRSTGYKGKLCGHLAQECLSLAPFFFFFKQINGRTNERANLIDTLGHIWLALSGLQSASPAGSLANGMEDILFHLFFFFFFSGGA